MGGLRLVMSVICVILIFTERFGQIECLRLNHKEVMAAHRGHSYSTITSASASASVTNGTERTALSAANKNKKTFPLLMNPRNTKKKKQITLTVTAQARRSQRAVSSDKDQRQRLKENLNLSNGGYPPVLVEWEGADFCPAHSPVQETLIPTDGRRPDGDYNHACFWNKARINSTKFREISFGDFSGAPVYLSNGGSPLGFLDYVKLIPVIGDVVGFVHAVQMVAEGEGNLAENIVDIVLSGLSLAMTAATLGASSSAITTLRAAQTAQKTIASNTLRGLRHVGKYGLSDAITYQARVRTLMKTYNTETEEQAMAIHNKKIKALKEAYKNITTTVSYNGCDPTPPPAGEPDQNLWTTGVLLADGVMGEFYAGKIQYFEIHARINHAIAIMINEAGVDCESRQETNDYMQGVLDRFTSCYYPRMAATKDSDSIELAYCVGNTKFQQNKADSYCLRSLKERDGLQPGEEFRRPCFADILDTKKYWEPIFSPLTGTCCAKCTLPVGSHSTDPTCNHDNLDDGCKVQTLKAATTTCSPGYRGGIFTGATCRKDGVFTGITKQCMPACQLPVGTVSTDSSCNHGGDKCTVAQLNAGRTSCLPYYHITKWENFNGATCTAGGVFAGIAACKESYCGSAARGLKHKYGINAHVKWLNDRRSECFEPDWDTTCMWKRTIGNPGRGEVKIRDSVDNPFECMVHAAIDGRCANRPVVKVAADLTSCWCQGEPINGVLFDQGNSVWKSCLPPGYVYVPPPPPAPPAPAPYVPRPAPAPVPPPPRGGGSIFGGPNLMIEAKDGERRKDGQGERKNERRI